MDVGIVGYGAYVPMFLNSSTMEKEVSYGLKDFPERQYFISLKNDFREAFFYTAVKKVGSWRKLASLIINPNTRKPIHHRTVLGWHEGKRKQSDGKFYTQSIPLWAIKQILNFTTFSSEEVEKNVTAYRAKAGTYISNPKLPIRITPSLFALIGHMISDGSMNTKGHTACYTNMNQILIFNFKNILIDTFGDIELVTHKVKTYFVVDVPKAVEYILIHFLHNYDVLKLPKNCKSAFIRAVFDDEGSINHNQLKFYSNDLKRIYKLKEMLKKDFNIETGKVIISSRRQKAS